MIAVHHRPGSFSDRWIAYLTERRIDHRVVNGFHTQIVEDLRGCSALLWHFHLSTMRDLRYARHVLHAAEALGLRVFPNYATCWHYDDKVAQKYLLEAVSAPLVPTWIFHDRGEALNWAASAAWPKVFKLRRGAGSVNVRLVNSRNEANKLIMKMFGPGMKATARPGEVLRINRGQFSTVSKCVARLERLPGALRRRSRFPREQDYALFQEFIPGNLFDTRITTIGNRAFCFHRAVRKGDFRASGSGHLLYPKPDAGDMDAIGAAFAISRRLGFQSMAYDFLTDVNSGHRLVSEISFAYNGDAVHACPGYFDQERNWHEGSVWPQDAILDDVLDSVGARLAKPPREVD